MGVLILMTMEEYLKTKCNEMISDVEALLKQLRVIGTGTLVRYLSRISETYPYDSLIPYSITDSIVLTSTRY